MIPAGYVNMKDLTFEQIDELNASIQMMLHEGGQYLNALKQLGVERVGQLVDKIDARMEKLPEFHKGKRDATTFLGKASAVSDKFAAYMTRMEFLFDAMDGYTSLWQTRPTTTSSLSTCRATTRSRACSRHMCV